MTKDLERGIESMWCHKVITAICVFVTLFSTAAYATDRHVGSGQTYSTIQLAVNAAACGDTIYLHSGTLSGGVDINGKGCSSGSPLTITPYSTDTVNVSPGSGNDFRVRNSNYIYIHGKNQLTFTGGSSVREYGVIQTQDTQYLQVKDCTITSNASSNAGFHTWAITSALIQGVTFNGSAYRHIEGGTQSDTGTPALEIAQCVFVNPGYAGVEGSGRDNWYVHKNYFYHSSSGAHLLVHRGGSGWKMENNIFEVRSGGALDSLVVLRSNTDYSGDNISNETYMNNTFVTTGGTVSNSYGVVFLGWGDAASYEHQNVRIQNNLFIGNWSTGGGIFQFGSGSPVAQNSYINNNHKTASDANSPWGTPNGYTMSSNTNGAVSYVASGNKPSPYFDLSVSYDGSLSNSPPSDDYDGVTRNSPPDIGAFEYGTGGGGTTPPSAQGCTIQGGTFR